MHSIGFAALKVRILHQAFKTPAGLSFLFSVLILLALLAGCFVCVVELKSIQAHMAQKKLLWV
jgi:hypothetical protein